MSEIRINLKKIDDDAVFRFTNPNGTVMSTPFIKGQKLLFAKEVLSNLQEFLNAGKLHGLIEDGAACQFMGNGSAEWQSAKIKITIDLVLEEDTNIDSTTYEKEYS